MTTAKAIHTRNIPKAAIERDTNAYLADGKYYAYGTIYADG